ncbi:MAG: YdcF family protein [Ignavibacteriaceae bacterium]
MPVKSKTDNKLKTVLPVIIIILLADLLFLYYLKYNNQNLSLSEFRLTNIGNFLNLFFTVVCIVGLILYSAQRKLKPNTTIIISFTVVLTIILIFAAISIKIKLPLGSSYMFSRPLPEVITGFLFLLHLFILFIFISFLWFSLFGGRDLLILRASVNSVIIVVVLFLFAFLYLSTKKDVRGINLKTKSQANIAVVLGAAVWSNNVPSPSLAARAEKAAELYRKGYVGHVQLTGGNAPGELSEAEVAYNFIKKKSIDTTRILLEKNTTSTSEQVEFIKNNLLISNSVENIIIVSDSYHLTRIGEICSFYNVKADLVASDLMLSFENKIYYKLRESIALILFWLFAL